MDFQQAEYQTGNGEGAAAGRAWIPKAARVDGPQGQGKGQSRAGNVFDSLITVALVALSFGVPLFFTGVTFQGVGFDKQLFFYFWLLVGLVSWVSKGVVVGEIRIRRTPIDIPILLFVGFYILSSFFSVDKWHSFFGFFGDPSRGVVSVLALALMYYLLLSHFTPRRFGLIFGGFLISGMLVIVWSLLALNKIPFLPQTLQQYAPLSLIGTVTTLAIYLTLLVPAFFLALFAVWTHTGLRKGVRNILLGVLGFFLAATLFLMLTLYPYLLNYETSLTWLIPLSGLSFFLVYILARVVRPPEALTWVPMLAFVLLLAFLMIGDRSLARATLPIEVTPNIKLSTQVAFESVKEKFLFGVGPANYGYAFSLFRPEEYNQNTLYTLRFYQGSGLFFEFLSTIGVIGTALGLLVIFSFLSIGLYLLSHEKQHNKIYSLGLWAIAVMLFLAFFTAALNAALVILGVLLSALALAVLLWESGSEERYLSLSLKASPKYALTLAFLFMIVSAGVAFLFVFIGKVFFADLAAGRAVRLSAEGPQKETLVLLANASRNYSQEGRYSTRLGQEYIALANQEAGRGAAQRNVDTIRAYVQDAVAAAELGRTLMPNDAMAVESLALIYENAGLYAADALPKAEAAYTRALELEPNNPLYYLKLGQVKRVAADAKPEGEEKMKLYAEASDYFQQSIDKKRNLAPAYYNLAVSQARQQKINEAIENTSRALTLDRNNINFKYQLGVLFQIRDDEGDKEKAEFLFKEVLGENDKLVDVRLSLGLLYEAQGKKTEALSEYERIVSLIPEDATGNVLQTREQIQKLINNLRSGKSNLTKSSSEEFTPPNISPAGPLPEPNPVPPLLPNASPLEGPLP